MCPILSSRVREEAGTSQPSRDGRPLRIILLSQYFPPEIGATQARMEAFASHLAGRGHRVTVICEFPNHLAHYQATGRALAVVDETARMSALLELVGVGVPTASTLLCFAFPDRYPILDVRALESLGVMPRSQYPLSFWLGYLEACRELAARCGVSLRTLDKALWQHSKER